MQRIPICNLCLRRARVQVGERFGRPAVERRRRPTPSLALLLLSPSPVVYVRVDLCTRYQSSVPKSRLYISYNKQASLATGALQVARKRVITLTLFSVLFPHLATTCVYSAARCGVVDQQPQSEQNRSKKKN